MKKDDVVLLEGSTFIVEKSDGKGFALVHRAKTKNDLRVIRVEQYEFNRKLNRWQKS